LRNRARSEAIDVAADDPELQQECWLYLQVVCGLIPIVDLSFAPVFPLLPGVAADPFWSRVFISVFAVAVWAAAALVPAIRARADLALVLVLTTLHAVTAFQVVSSGNHPMYTSAALLAVFGSQLAMTNLRDLVVVLGSGLVAFVAFAGGTDQLDTVNDWGALLVLASGAVISGAMGVLRIRIQDRERFARRALGRQTTELARAEAVAREARIYAEAANQAKSAFLASMSHELRTPLNAILGYTELLQDVAADDGLTHLDGDLKKISGAGTHLLTLINDILDLAKVESGRMEVSNETFALDRFLTELEGLARPLAVRRSNAFEVRGDAAFSITTDRVRFKQVLLNLVSNAAKFTEHGTIAITVTRDGARVRFEVSDTGVGMNPEQLSRLFEAFVQVHVDRERYGGTGLGLVLCKRFTELLKGDLAVRSAVGAGTTFTVSLPVA
jgi:signal transduction histidine kinase